MRASSAGPGARAAGRSGRSAVDPSARPFAPPAPDPSPRSGAYARPAGKTASCAPARAPNALCVSGYGHCSPTKAAKSGPSCTPSMTTSRTTSGPPQCCAGSTKARAPDILRELSAGSTTAHPRRPRRAARRQTRHTPAQHPGRHRGPPATRRADGPASSAGPAASSPIATIPANNNCSTPTRCGISCGDCVPAWAARIPPTGRPSSFSSTSGRRSNCSTGAPPATSRSRRLGRATWTTWLSSDEASHRRQVGNFVRWAKKQKLTNLEFPAVKWDGPAGVIDTEARWANARRLLHDDTVRTRGPRRRSVGPALRPMAGRDQPPHPRTRPDQRRHRAFAAGPRTGRAARTTRRPRPRPGRTADGVMPLSATKAPHPGCSPAGDPDTRSAAPA